MFGRKKGAEVLVFLVCVICNCKIYIQTLHNDVTHIEDGCAPPILCTFVKYFYMFLRVLNLEIFSIRNA